MKSSFYNEMVMQSPIAPPGKDAPLQQTIDKALGWAERLGLRLRFDSLGNPAPGFWSVHLFVDELPELYANGKGISREAAMASALGEIFERLATGFSFADFCLSPSRDNDRQYYFHPKEYSYKADGDAIILDHPKEILTPELWQLYDPERQLTAAQLKEANYDNPDRGVLCLPLVETSSKKKVFFPVSLLQNLYVSNGMAAGNSINECRCQALSEIFERHVRELVFSSGIALPDIPAAILASYPHLQAMVRSLEEHHLLVMVKDASLGGQFPVVCIICMDQATGGILTSFGCNSRLIVAIERSLTELLQGRALNSIAGMSQPTHNLAAAGLSFNLESHFINGDGLVPWQMLRDKPDFSYHHWDFSGSTAKEWQHLQDLVQAMGAKIYAMDYPHLGMHVSQLVVPGVSEIYPQEDLIYANRNRSAALRRQLQDLDGKDPKSLEQCLDLIQELGFANEQGLAEEIGILAEEDSLLDSLQIAELAALCSCLSDRRAEAGDYLEWSMAAAGDDGTKAKRRQLFHTLLGFAIHGDQSEAYGRILAHLHRQEELDSISVKDTALLQLSGLDRKKELAGLGPRHQKLILVYHRLRRCQGPAAT